MSVHRQASCPCCGGSLRGAFDRRRFLLGAGGAAALALSPRVSYAQTAPIISYDSIPNPLHLPSNVGNPVQCGHRFQRKADSNPVIADSR